MKKSRDHFLRWTGHTWGLFIVWMRGGALWYTQACFMTSFIMGGGGGGGLQLCFHYAKDSGNFGRNLPVKIFRPKFVIPFFTNWFFALIREFGKGIKNGKEHSFWLARLRKMLFHFPRVFPLISDQSVWHNDHITRNGGGSGKSQCQSMCCFRIGTSKGWKKSV